MENLALLPDRQVIVADKQTNGRGRLDRKWISDKKGNVYLSIILKNTALVNYTPHMASALCSVLKNSYGIDSTIKDPNDVMVGGKKISGILSQSSTRGDIVNGIVLGVGVNLNLTEDDLLKIDQPATALNLLLGEVIDRDLFIDKLLDTFFKEYNSITQVVEPHHH